MLLRRLSINSLILIASNGGSAVLAFALTLLIARGLGDSALGQYAAVMAWILPLTLFVDFGIGTLITRNIAQHPTHAAQYLRVALPARLVLGGSIILLVWVIAPYLSDDEIIIKGLRITVGLVLIDSLFGNYTAVFRAWEMMLPILFLNLGLLTMQVIVAAVVVYQEWDVTALLMGIVLADAIQLAATWLVWRRLKSRFIVRHQEDVGAVSMYPPILRGDDENVAPTMRHLLKTAFPFMVAGVLASLQLRGVILMLEQLDSTAAIGWYAAANRVTEALRLIPTALFGALFPALAALVQNPEQFRRTFRYALSAVSIYGGFVVLAIFIGKDSLVDGLYGAEFSPASSVMLILSVALLFGVIRAVLTLWFYAFHQEHIVNRWLAVTLVLQFLLALWIIPIHRVVGAGWVVLFGEIVLVLLLAKNRPSLHTLQ